MKQVRADWLLVHGGWCESREQARRLIVAGQVRLGPDRVVRKPSELLPVDAQPTLTATAPFVSRGAGKLLPALEAWLPDLTGMVAMDVGSSTGGFTDLMLQRGASRVHAIDVGHGQLHARLRADPRVVVHEGVNARYLPVDFLPTPVAVVAIDVSFISVTLILPAVNPLLQPDGYAFVLVKPQFEAGRDEVGKGGVVRDLAIRQACLTRVTDCAVRQCGWTALGHFDSPVIGPKGNCEIIAGFRKPPVP